MSDQVKKLAGQTLWYGVPTIASRFIGYILSIFLFRWYGPEATADITQVYAIIPFLLILYTYGLETAYFRFVSQTAESNLFNTLSISLLVSTLIFSTILWAFTPQIADFAGISQHPQYIHWMILVVITDTFSLIPFARLRQQERPRKYALIRVISILLTVLLSIVFLRWLPQLYQSNPSSSLLLAYNPQIGIGYYILANALANLVGVLLLWKEWADFRFSFDKELWKKVLRYAYPLIIVGLGGMINEMMSRLIYAKVIPVEPEEARRQLGIFGASYKVAVLITMFIQVFRMAAEPFFFKESKQKNAPATYARVMKFFILACSLMWLAITLNLDTIAHLAYGKNFEAYREGTSIIPILAMGSVFLGAYYNLSIWYKLTNKTWWGAVITIMGAVMTVLLNIWWIPKYGYTGSAWATFVCYFFMMSASWLLGQRYYPVPYEWQKLGFYLVLAAIIYLVHQIMLRQLTPGFFNNYLIPLFLLTLYGLLIFFLEKKEFGGLLRVKQKLP